MAFDTTIQPESYVVEVRRNSSAVYGPADTADGACYSREKICECTRYKHEQRARLICELLNDSQKP